MSGKPHVGRWRDGEAGGSLWRDIAAADQDIDELVYDLYGITDEERKIIEAAL